MCAKNWNCSNLESTDCTTDLLNKESLAQITSAGIFLQAISLMSSTLEVETAKIDSYIHDDSV